MRTKLIHGVVESLYYSGPNFATGQLRTDDGGRVKFAGAIYVKANDPVSLRGHWEQHPKYGRQFTVDAMESQIDLDPIGLENYLANNPEIRGIGPVKAKLIRKTCGDSFDRMIRDHPEAIAEGAGLPLEVILNLQQNWIQTSGLNYAMTFLSRYGLTHYQVKTLVDEFGNDIVAMIQENPYLLIGKIHGFGFKKVDEIASRVGVPRDLPARIQAGIEYLVHDAINRGDCWVEYSDLLIQADNLLFLEGPAIESQLTALVKEGRLICEPHFEQQAVAEPRLFRMEQFLAGIFENARERGPHAGTEIPSGILHELNDDQQAGVRQAFDYSISLLTGGAGSGKTFTVKAVLEMCGYLGLSYDLAAPTGKAAKRLEQSTGRRAQTVHRLLGYDGHTFAKGPTDTIGTDFLVIDEVSMMDVPLMFHLFQAIDLERTAVLLVGDHNQLPPVGPGNVLRDLMLSEAVPITVLSKIIRQAGPLKENSTAILKGIVRPTTTEKDKTRQPWYLVNRLSDPQEILAYLETLFTKGLEDLGFNLLRDVQVLTPIHKGPLGTLELNILLQRLVQKKLFDVEVPPVEANRRPVLFRGDKVIQTKNDYEIDVMNGAVGCVTYHNPKDRLTVEFEDEEIEILPGTGKEQFIQLAYATSIHKMQGSEFPCSIVIIHKSHSRMHHRNLLYTAVTRAQKTVILIGDKWGIEHCASMRQVDQRKTFLQFFLGGEVNAND